MFLKKETILRSPILFACLFITSNLSYAAVSVNDNLTGVSSNYNWQAISGACLTAGNNTGPIPACVGLPYYKGKTLVGGVNGRLPDPVGQGALRLTNGDTTSSGSNGTNQTGAVYSKDVFPSNAGVDITFKTVTYGGNGYRNNFNVASGADGIAFFLVDADQVKTVDGTTVAGSFGGSLGYSCANDKNIDSANPNGSDGLYGAYIGLGIDEFGNFSNSGDTTNTGPGVGWNRVTLRGAGNVNWKWLSENKPQYYPPSVLRTRSEQNEAVKQTCRSGNLLDFSRNRAVVPRTGDNYKGFYNYPYITHSDIMDTKQNNSDTDNNRKLRKAIFNQQATNMPKRGNATPITYNLKITQDGLLSLAYSYNNGQSVQVLNKQNITASNGPLPKNFRFGFAAGTGGGSNVHEIMCFKAEQITGSSSSASANIPALGRVVAGSQLYIASYNTQNWWGQLSARNLVENIDTGEIKIGSLANWDAHCKLTGGQCESTGNNIPAQTSRKFYTWNQAGVELDWERLNQNQKSSLGNNEQEGKLLLNWLKGDRSNEWKSNGVGSLRLRDSLLGDIINSSPTWVGSPSSPYTDAWRNKLHGGAMLEEESSYDDFKNSKKMRSHVVYVGANDGYLHAFRSGKQKGDGSFDASNNDGEELFAYMPDQVLRTIANSSNPNLSLPSTAYGYNAFVDATPGAGDLFYNGAWHTWLVGGLGLGGNSGGVVADDTTVSKGAIYALDITDPENFSSKNVLGEWNSDNLKCTNITNCGDSLGSTVGIPIIRRMHDGNWGVIFPNGINSKTGEAGIYVMTIDQKDGSKSFTYVKASGPKLSGSSILARNGISQITGVDLDGDHIVDYVYGGDVLGNIWRFDLTSKSKEDWSVDDLPIFKTTQPITTSIMVSATVSDEGYRVILNFGTGRVYPKTLESAAKPVGGENYINGIWDANFIEWNKRSIFDYQVLQLKESEVTVTANELASREIINNTYVNNESGVNGIRTISGNNLCWRGQSCSSTGVRGWRMKLPEKDEQIIYNPIFQDGFVVFNTTVPEVDGGAFSCDTKVASGFTMAIPPDSGMPKKSYFIDPWNGGVIAGLGASGVGSVFIVRSATRTFGVTQTQSGEPKSFELNPMANSSFKRVNWIKRR